MNEDGQYYLLVYDPDGYEERIIGIYTDLEKAKEDGLKASADQWNIDQYRWDGLRLLDEDGEWWHQKIQIIPITALNEPIDRKQWLVVNDMKRHS